MSNRNPEKLPSPTQRRSLLSFCKPEHYASPPALKPGWDHEDAEQLLADLKLKLFHLNHGGE